MLARTLKGKGKEILASHVGTYLAGVHLELAHHFDGDFAGLAISISRTVNIAEGAVAHLLYEFPPFEAYVVWQLPGLLPLLCHHPGQFFLLDLLLLRVIYLLVVVCSVGRSVSGWGCSVLVVDA